MTLGARLRRLRTERQWSIRELSRRAGVRRDIIAELEKGRKTSTQLSFVQRLAATLGVSVAYLIGAGQDEVDGEQTEAFQRLLPLHTA